MIKKFILGLLIGTLPFTFIGCSKKEKNPFTQPSQTQSKKNHFVELAELGFSFTMPKEWDNNEKYIDGIVLGASPDSSDPLYGGLKLSYIPKESVEKMQSFTTDVNSKNEKEWKDLLNTLKPLVHFNIYHKDKINSTSIENLSGLAHNIFLGEQEDLVYYLCYPDPNTIVGLSQSSQKMYDQFYKDIANIKNTVKIFKPTLPTHDEHTAELMGAFPSFEAMDINHNSISSSIFKDYPLTMIHIWATYEDPCIDQIPDLQNLYSEMKKQNVNIIGIIEDAQDHEELAQKILSQNKVTYSNIIPDKILQTKFLNTLSSYPTSIFVDQQGNIVGKPIIGSKSKEEYKKNIIETLELIKKQNIKTP
ncbi:TlpA family protein disulfide reductase [Inediibacterium massiliense]|uniref:TlpA family protein disulfide reductase n=1 Tax=Inediibacterium massiliense TaxID=1658111 RepID=UPI0006B5DD3A|nr:TlpA disulfide reductase family protein [Inediibacterium massiliense]